MFRLPTFWGWCRHCRRRLLISLTWLKYQYLHDCSCAKQTTPSECCCPQISMSVRPIRVRMEKRVWAESTHTRASVHQGAADWIAAVSLNINARYIAIYKNHFRMSKHEFTVVTPNLIFFDIFV